MPMCDELYDTTSYLYRYNVTQVTQYVDIYVYKQ